MFRFRLFLRTYCRKLGPRRCATDSLLTRSTRSSPQRLCIHSRLVRRGFMAEPTLHQRSRAPSAHPNAGSAGDACHRSKVEQQQVRGCDFVVRTRYLFVLCFVFFVHAQDNKENRKAISVRTGKHRPCSLGYCTAVQQCRRNEPDHVDALRIDCKPRTPSSKRALATSTSLIHHNIKARVLDNKERKDENMNHVFLWSSTSK